MHINGAILLTINTSAAAVGVVDNYSRWTKRREYYGRNENVQKEVGQTTQTDIRIKRFHIRETRDGGRVVTASKRGRKRVKK